MPSQTISIEVPSSLVPKELTQDALRDLFVDWLRSKGWIDNEDVAQLVGTSVRTFEKRLAEHHEKPTSARQVAKRESKWAKLATHYRENPCLEGKSEELNSLIREFREEFAV